MNRKPAYPPLTDADLDQALAHPGDSLLPSSGFADAVMASVLHDASAPPPLSFPWKRAIPGLASAVAAIVLLLAVLPSVLASASASAGPGAPASFAGHSLPASLSQINPAALGLTISVGLLLACLALCRRLIAPR